MGARPAPVVLGHEGSGVVTEVGAAVTGVRPGDHVLLSFVFCGTCRECRQGSPACCEEFNLRTVTGGYPDGSTGAVGNPVRNRWSGQSSSARAVPKVCLPRLIDFWRDGRFPFDRPIRTHPMDDIDTAERDPRSGVTIKPVLLS
jgi:Zn-dependent alcohol dehydrogenase